MADRFFVERITGVGPAFTAWEAVVLPMNYIRKSICIISRLNIEFKQKAVEKIKKFKCEFVRNVRTLCLNYEKNAAENFRRV